jgi:hypothetical protein
MISNKSLLVRKIMKHAKEAQLIILNPTYQWNWIFIFKCRLQILFGISFWLDWLLWFYKVFSSMLRWVGALKLDSLLVDTQHIFFSSYNPNIQKNVFQFFYHELRYSIHNKHWLANKTWTNICIKFCRI